MNFKKQYIALALLMATQVQITFGLSAGLQGQVTELRKLAANAKNSAIIVKMKTIAQGINRYADDVNKMPSVNEAVKAEIEAVRTDINNLMTRIGLGVAPVAQVRPAANAQQAPVRQPVVTAAAQMVRAARTTVPTARPAHQAGLLRYRMGGRVSGQRVVPAQVAPVVLPAPQVVVPAVEVPAIPVSIATPASQVENVVTVQRQDASTTVEPIVIMQKTDASTCAHDAQVSLIDGGVQASAVSCDAATQAQDVRVEQLQQQLARKTQEHDFDKNRLEAADEEIDRMGKALYRKESIKPRKVSVETQAQVTAAVVANATTQADDVRQDEIAALRAQLQAQQEAHNAHVAKLERRLNQLNTELTNTLDVTDREIVKLNKSLFAASAKPSKKDAITQAIAPVVNSVAGSTQTQCVLTSSDSQADLQTNDDVVVPVVSAPYVGEPRESHVYDKINFLASKQRPVVTEPAPVVAPVVVSEQQDQVHEEVAPVEQQKQVAGPKKSKPENRMLRNASVESIDSVVTAQVQPANATTAKPSRPLVNPLRNASPTRVTQSTPTASAVKEGKKPAASQAQQSTTDSLWQRLWGKKPVAQPANNGRASASASSSKFSKVQDQPAS